MDFPAVIAQLRAQVPVFGGRVAGAANFATGLETPVWLDLPAAYVIPLSEDADANDVPNALYQLVTERIGVVVEFDNSTDRRGQSVTALFAATRAAIFSALLNWRALDPDHALRGFEYGGGQVLQFDRARLFYQFEFTFPTVITDADGWQVDTPYLAEITAYETAQAYEDPGDPSPSFAYVPPSPPSE